MALYRGLPGAQTPWAPTPRRPTSRVASTADGAGGGFGGATGIRTLDLLHAMQALFQLSYSPTIHAQSERITDTSLDLTAWRA
jgi:hypothetical protein